MVLWISLSTIYCSILLFFLHNIVLLESVAPPRSRTLIAAFACAEIRCFSLYTLLFPASTQAAPRPCFWLCFLWIPRPSSSLRASLIRLLFGRSASALFQTRRFSHAYAPCLPLRKFERHFLSFFLFLGRWWISAGIYYPQTKGHFSGFFIFRTQIVFHCTFGSFSPLYFRCKALYFLHFLPFPQRVFLCSSPVCAQKYPPCPRCFPTGYPQKYPQNHKSLEGS